MKMTTVYRGQACASAGLGTLPMFYLILPKSHGLLASHTRTVGEGRGCPMVGYFLLATTPPEVAGGRGGGDSSLPTKRSLNIPHRADSTQEPHFKDTGYSHFTDKETEAGRTPQVAQLVGHPTS